MNQGRWIRSAERENEPIRRVDRFCGRLVCYFSAGSPGGDVARAFCG